MSFFDGVPQDKRNDATSVAAEDADKYAALYALSTSEGGTILLGALKDDILSAIDKLANAYATLPEQEMRAECASMNVKLNILRSLTRSKDNLDGALATLDELIA